MKICHALLLAFAALLMAPAQLSAQQQQAPLQITDNDVKVELEFVEAPRIGVENLVAKGGGGIGSPRWLEIYVAYTMPYRVDQQTKQMEWIDEMSISARVLLYPAEYRGSRVTALLTGKQVFASVPCDGKKHRAALYVPPVVLLRYTSADFKLNKAAAKDLAAFVLFATKQQQTIGAGIQVPKGSNVQATQAAFRDAETKLGILRLENSILPREATPWEDLDYDSYDMPKPTLPGGR